MKSNKKLNYKIIMPLFIVLVIGLAAITGITESYGSLNVVAELIQQYTITFAQITTQFYISLKISNGTKAIEKFTSGAVFATYLNNVVADVLDFTSTSGTFEVRSGNVYMK